MKRKKESICSTHARDCPVLMTPAWPNHSHRPTACVLWLGAHRPRQRCCCCNRCCAAPAAARPASVCRCVVEGAKQACKTPGQIPLLPTSGQCNTSLGLLGCGAGASPRQCATLTGTAADCSVPGA